MALKDLAWYVNYGNGATTGYYAVPVFPVATSVAAGVFYRQLTTPAVGSERLFVVTVAGVTTTEPSWTVTRGAVNTSGTATLQECTGIPACNGDIGSLYQNQRLNSTAYTLGSVIYDPVTLSVQILSTASGNTASSAPSFSATAGVTTNDASNVWTSLGLASSFSAFQNPHARLGNAFAVSWGQAGNSFAVASNHAETQSSAITLNLPGSLSSPSGVYCISNSTILSSPTLAASATLSTTGVSNINIGNSTGVGYFYGLNLLAGSGSSTANIELVTNIAVIYIFDTCVLQLNNTSNSSFIALGPSSGARESIKLLNCSLLFGSTGQGVDNGNYNTVSAFFMEGGSVASSGSIPSSFLAPGMGKPFWGLFRDVDLSALTGTLVTVGSWTGGDIYFQNCKLAPGVTIRSGTYLYGMSPAIHLANCDSNSTNYRYYFDCSLGTVQQETTIVRTGGASNGTTGISWNITTSANASFLQPFVSEEIEIWNSIAGSPITVTFYLTSNTALSNKNFWAEVEYLGNSGNPLGSTVKGMMALLGTPTGLTTDSSTWGGSIANKYNVTLTFTPQMAGVVKARFYVGVPSTTIYVDPEIYGVVTSSRQYFAPGWGMVNEGAAGGGGLLIHMDMSGGCNG